MLFVVFITAVVTVNCFAYTKIKDLAYINKLGKYATLDSKVNSINEILPDTFKKIYPNDSIYIGDFRTNIVTNEYKLLNGNAIVKVRDIIAAMGGSLEYNPNTKAVKAYIPKFSVTYNSVRSFSITPGKTEVDLTVISYPNENRLYKTHNSRIAPRIIDNFLYVSAIDLGEVLGKYSAYDELGYIDYSCYGDNTRLLNGIIYIEIFGYLR